MLYIGTFYKDRLLAIPQTNDIQYMNGSIRNSTGQSAAAGCMGSQLQCRHITRPANAREWVCAEAMQTAHLPRRLRRGARSLGTCGPRTTTRSRSLRCPAPVSVATFTVSLTDSCCRLSPWQGIIQDWTKATTLLARLSLLTIQPQLHEALRWLSLPLPHVLTWTTTGLATV